MRQSYDYDSATMYTYIDWVLTEKLNFDNTEVKKYENLNKVLSNIDFFWEIPMDENRAADGLALRRDFEYETGLFLDSSSGLPPVCTMFEMMAALAYRCEHQLMRNLSKGDRSGLWFTIMLKNLDIYISNREWNRNSESYIREKVDQCLARDYGATGKGSLFPIRKRGINQKNQEIWKQLMAYINENYSDDDPDLELYRRH